MYLPFSTIDGIENGPMKSLLEHLDAAGFAHFTALMNDIVQRGVTEQGNIALGSEREDAAAHEAGHVIFAAAVGLEVRSVWIRRAKLDPRFIASTGIKTFWTGFTDAGNGMSVTSDTAFASDVLHAANMLAGFTAEMYLLRDHIRLASSASERTVAQIIADNISVKTGEDPRALLMDIGFFLHDLFTENDKSLRAVARALERDRRISGPKLTALLAGVQPVTTITLACPRFGKSIPRSAIPLRAS